MGLLMREKLCGENRKKRTTSCRFMLLPNYLISEISFIMPPVFYFSSTCDLTLAEFSLRFFQWKLLFHDCQTKYRKICRTFFSFSPRVTNRFHEFMSNILWKLIKFDRLVNIENFELVMDLDLQGKE